MNGLTAFAWTRLVHPQRPSADILAIEVGDRSFGLRLIWHFHETKAPGPASLPVRQYLYGGDRSEVFKSIPQFRLAEAVRQISDIDIH